MHYHRMVRYGDVGVVKIERNKGKKCLVGGCNKEAKAKGLCFQHYGLLHTYGRGHNIINKKGEGTITKDGYIEHGSNGRRHKKEHIEIAERALGRPLPPGAVVHHANGDRRDNRPENLVVCPDHAYHMLLHKRIRRLARGEALR